MSLPNDPWSYRLGVLAWAPSPFASKQALHDWPCILYPSWSKAMTQSGLITDEKVLKLIGCKKSTAVTDLAKNSVPKIAALGSGLNGSKFRPKVVVHYLGLDEEPSWGSVKVDLIKQYTIESCSDVLRNVMEKCAENDGSAFRCKVQALYLAMQEASIVMGKPSYNPKNICNDCEIENLLECEKKSIRSNAHKKDVQEEQLTPENFDDWRLGGSTQTNSQSQTQSFSQGIVLSSRS